MDDLDGAASAGGDVTERATRAHLERRIETLEAELARATQSRDAVREEAAFFRERLAKLGRMVQVAILVRGALRHPSRIPALPGRLRAVVAARGAPAMPDAASDAVGPSPKEVAAERRIAVAHALRERSARNQAERALGELRVALVADDELAANLAPDCHLTPLRPDDWRTRLDEERPDLLLVESAWHGPHGSWQYRIAWHGHPDALRQTDLTALVEHCRELDVPTVFWHTEAPHLVARFRQAAAPFDLIVAADEEAAAAYEAVDERTAPAVAVAAHAVQPRRHHVTGGEPAAATPVYVGSWDPTLPLPRREALERVLDAGAPHGLRIHDRRLGLEPGGSRFPTRFAGSVSPSWLAADQIPGAYREHRLVLDSPVGSGIPRRLLEALASGTPAVTTSSPATADLLGDFVRTADDEPSLAAVIGDALRDDALARRVRFGAPAMLYRTETYAHRLASIASAVGYRVAVPRPGVALLALADDRSVPAWEPQTLAALQVDEIVLGTADWDAGREVQSSLASRLDGIAVRLVEQRADVDRGERLRRLAAAAHPGWVGIIDASKRDPGALLSLSSALQYADADVIGLADDDSARQGAVTSVANDLALARRQLVLERGWPATSNASADVMARWSAEGVRLYSVGAVGDLGT